jgi:amino-acid N-acetyltransferase
MMEWKIRNAKQSDLESIIPLLSECKMPIDGICAESILNFLVAETTVEKDCTLAGVSGLEIYGESALLRSVAVHKNLRGKGIGNDLVIRTLEKARNKKIKRIYLFTETAQGYFSRFGFKKIQRRQIEIRVQQSAEFMYACPKSAIALKLEFKDTGR